MSTLITQEQADAINNLREMDFEDGSIIHNTVYVKVSNVSLHGGYEVLSRMRLDDLIKALYIGYEVAPEFEVGDLVYVDWNNGAKVHEVKWAKGVKTTSGNPAIEVHNSGNPFAPLDITRHATPEEIAEEKQRRWWSEHGRGVWEIREGDVVINPQTENVLFVTADMKPSENDKKTYKIMSFAEDRKDL